MNEVGFSLFMQPCGQNTTQWMSDLQNLKTMCAGRKGFSRSIVLEFNAEFNCMHKYS